MDVCVCVCVCVFVCSIQASRAARTLAARALATLAAAMRVERLQPSLRIKRPLTVTSRRRLAATAALAAAAMGAAALGGAASMRVSRLVALGRLGHLGRRWHTQLRQCERRRLRRRARAPLAARRRRARHQPLGGTRLLPNVQSRTAAARGRFSVGGGRGPTARFSTAAARCCVARVPWRHECRRRRLSRCARRCGRIDAQLETRRLAALYRLQPSRRARMLRRRRRRRNAPSVDNYALCWPHNDRRPSGLEVHRAPPLQLQDEHLARRRQRHLLPQCRRSPKRAVRGGRRRADHQSLRRSGSQRARWRRHRKRHPLRWQRRSST